ncbi:hypothetical protein PV326_005493 [Microctonus aethiopoides]|nr:hypothetical protein PV326_005493 [Microctonus aethiopoides]
MSCQKGSENRSRPQKYQNSHAFKNNLHDTSHKTKFINSIQVVNVCERCKKIIEWKIKYKKYKPLKAPGICTKCQGKCVKHAYHTMCGPCASQHQVCPKCGEKSEIIKPEIENEPLRLDRELRLLLKKLPERKRRTFLRYMNRKAAAKENAKKAENSNTENKINSSDEDDSDSDTETEETTPLSRDDLLNKLKSLMITKKNNDEEDDSDDYVSDSDDDDDGDNSTNSNDSSDSDSNNEKNIKKL